VQTKINLFRNVQTKIYRLVLVKPNLLVIEELVRNPFPSKVVLLITRNDLNQLIKISDLNHDLNKIIFLPKKSFDLNHEFD